MINDLSKNPEWSEIKAFLLNELVEKPLTIKTDGISHERIAIELISTNKASEKIVKAIKKLERITKEHAVKSKPFR